MIFYVVDYDRMGPRPVAAKQINANTNLDVFRQRSVFKEMGKENMYRLPVKLAQYMHYR